MALEDVVERQLHGALGDVEERRGEPAVVAEDALLRVDLAQAVEHGAVGARRRPLCGDHPGLDDPDGVGEHRRRPPGGKRRKKVVPRLQRAVPVQVCVLQHQVLVLPVEVEVECPGRRRAKQVWTNSPVQVLKEPRCGHLPRGGVRRNCHKRTVDSPHSLPLRHRRRVQLQPQLHEVQRVRQQRRAEPRRQPRHRLHRLRRHRLQRLYRPRCSANPACLGYSRTHRHSFRIFFNSAAHPSFSAGPHTPL